jgi:hypothetical protein
MLPAEILEWLARIRLAKKYNNLLFRESLFHAQSPDLIHFSNGCPFALGILAGEDFIHKKFNVYA